MAQQVIFVTPSNDMAVIDDGAAPSFPTLNANTNIGYDTKNNQSGTYSQPTPGTVSQGANVYANTGSTTLDINGNDTVTPDPTVATVAGNPVSATQPTYKTVTKVINNAFNGVCVAWKNPAIIF